MIRLPTLALAPICICLLGACAGDGHDPDVDPAELACEQVGRAAREVTAAAARDGTAPALAFDGEPVGVTLPAGGSGHLRVVTDEPEALGILLFDQADVLAAVWTGDVSSVPPSAGPSPACPGDIPEHFDVDFETAGTHFLELGPTASDRVWVVLAAGAGHAD